MDRQIASRTLVPFLDLTAVHAPLKQEVLNAVADLIDSSQFTNGPPVRAFEERFAQFCGSSHCVGVGSGLDAIRLGLIALGVGPGDEVPVPANTFIATFEAISQVGGIPVPVDASEADYNVDAGALDAAIGASTRILLPVHLYGQLADMHAVARVAGRYGLQMLEDACQAHGAARDGLKAGTVGAAGAFSFYPGKNLGAMGDAGSLVTNDLKLAEAVGSLREHGQSEKYHHGRIGYTARLDTIQAAFLLTKLPLLEGWNEERRAIAKYYTEALADIGDLRLPPVPAGSSPVWHLYVIRTAEPESMALYLRERGIGTGRHYPEPPHLSDAYRHLGYKQGSFPVAELLSQEILSLPIFPGMSEEQREAVTDAVVDYFARA